MSDFVVLYSLTCWSLHHLSVYRLWESLRGRTESPSVSIAADPEGGSVDFPWSIHGAPESLASSPRTRSTSGCSSGSGATRSAR